MEFAEEEYQFGFQFRFGLLLNVPSANMAVRNGGVETYYEDDHRRAQVIHPVLP